MQADSFLTVLDPVDTHFQRLLWVRRRRSQATLLRELEAFGPDAAQALRFACSDVRSLYFETPAFHAIQAFHMLDRLSITGQLNRATDEVSRAQSRHLRARSESAPQRPKPMLRPLRAAWAGCANEPGKSSTPCWRVSWPPYAFGIRGRPSAIVCTIRPRFEPPTSRSIGGTGARRTRLEPTKGKKRDAHAACL